MSRQYLEQMNPKDLRPNPRNKHVFGDVTEGLQPLMNSIKRAGILSPIVLTSKRLIANGHRRHAAALALGLDRVPCFVSEDATIEGAMEKWRECQVTERQTTIEQRSRLAEEEAILLKEEKAIQPPETEPGLISPIGPESPTAENTEEKPDIPMGRPKKEKTQAQIDKEAARKSGLGSRTTAQRAAKVVAAIDEHESQGDTETAQELRETLNNQSVSAAVRKLEEIQTKDEPAGEKSLTDSAGKKIPADLIATFETRQLFVDVLAACKKVTSALKILSDDSIEFATVKLNKSQARNDLKNFLQQINYAIPHAVCPYCKGSGKHKGGGCQPCKGIGWLVKSAYDSVPEDER